jgi:hypothetical protein
MTTGVEGGALGAAPQPALVPQLPPFHVGPPESVTVSIILDDIDDARRCCHTLPSSSSDSRVKHEENDNGEEEEDEEVC